MNSIYTYTDYRKFLKDYYSKKKSEDSSFSYRHIANIVGFKSAGHFTQILNGTANISKKLADRFIKILRLRKREAEYFNLMVLFNQAKNHKDKKGYFEKMASFKKSSVKIVSSEQYEFYDKWYYSAIRELLDFYPFNGNDLKKLAKMIIPAVSSSEAQKAVRLLEKLGFIKKDEKGYYKKVDAVISTGYDAHSIAINNYFLNSLRLAGESLDRFGKEERNLSWLTLSLSQKGFEEVQRELRKFRRTALDIAGGDKEANTIYQFNFQVFPMSKPYEKRGK